MHVFSQVRFPWISLQNYGSDGKEETVIIHHTEFETDYDQDSAITNKRLSKGSMVGIVIASIALIVLGITVILQRRQLRYDVGWQKNRWRGENKELDLDDLEWDISGMKPLNSQQKFDGHKSFETFDVLTPTLTKKAPSQRDLEWDVSSSHSLTGHQTLGVHKTFDISKTFDANKTFGESFGPFYHLAGMVEDSESLEGGFEQNFDVDGNFPILAEF